MSGVQLGYEILLISFSSAQIHKCMLFLNARIKTGTFGFSAYSYPNSNKSGVFSK